MDVPHERRSGQDRRHRFLNGLDRRRATGPARIQPGEAAAARAVEPGLEDAQRSAGLWHNYVFAPPVE